MKLILLFLIGFIGEFCFSQAIHPELTSKITDVESTQLENKIEKIYSKNLIASPKEIYNLKLWKLYVYDSLGVSDKADTLAKELEAKSKELKYPIASKIYSRLGNIEIDNNEFKKAISYFHKGLTIATKFKDIKAIGSFKRLIGTSYLKLDQNETAEKYLRESFAMFKSISDTLGMANASISLGNALKDQGKIKEGIKYYEISLDLAKKINNQRLIAGNYNNLGNSERRLGNDKKALNYFFKALEMNLKSDNKLWQSFNYHNIANTYVDNKEYQRAIEFFKKSNTIKRTLGDSLSLITGYLGISEAYADIDDYNNAYNYLKMHVKLKDTMNLVEQSNALHALEAKYESEKKEAEISHLKTEKELQNVKNDSLEMKAKKNQILLILAFLTGIILLAGIGVLWKSNKTRRITNKLLENSNSTLQITMDELSEKNKEIIDSINYATYIQRATLPNISQHTSDFLQFELFFAPKDIVSGDFYFSYQLYNRSIFGVADCTGHGVPGAMVSLVGMNSLEKVIREEKHTNTGEMVESLNSHVIESLYRGSETLNDGMDISFCHLEHENNMLHFTGANHTAYIIRKNSFMDENIFNDVIHQKGRTDSFALLSLNGTRRPIGKTHSIEKFAQVSFKLLKGDRIILFSDGYADQTGGELSKKLKKGALLDFIMRSAELSVSNQAEFMKIQFDKWKGENEQVDDVCMLFVEIKR